MVGRHGGKVACAGRLGPVAGRRSGPRASCFEIHGHVDQLACGAAAEGSSSPVDGDRAGEDDDGPGDQDDGGADDEWCSWLHFCGISFGEGGGVRLLFSLILLVFFFWGKKKVYLYW